MKTRLYRNKWKFAQQKWLKLETRISGGDNWTYHYLCLMSSTSRRRSALFFFLSIHYSIINLIMPNTRSSWISRIENSSIADDGIITQPLANNIQFFNVWYTLLCSPPPPKSFIYATVYRTFIYDAYISPLPYANIGKTNT